MLFWSDSTVSWFYSMVIFDIFLARALNFFWWRSINLHWSLGRIDLSVLGVNCLFYQINISVICIGLLLLLWLTICGLREVGFLVLCLCFCCGSCFVGFMCGGCGCCGSYLYYFLLALILVFLFTGFYRCHGFEYYPQLIY